jgi:hypothetical protein
VSAADLIKGAEKVERLGIVRDPAYLYGLLDEGVFRVRPVLGAKHEVMARTTFVREPGFLYFVDQEGDVSRVPGGCGGDHEPPENEDDETDVAADAPLISLEKVARLGLSKEPGFVYFLRGSDVWRLRLGQEASSELVAKSGIQRESGYGYFLDADGDLVRYLRR